MWLIANTAELIRLITDFTNIIYEGKKILERVECQRSEEKNQKDRKGAKERILYWTKEDKMREFSRKSSFSKLSTTQKQTNHFCQLCVMIKL